MPVLLAPWFLTFLAVWLGWRLGGLTKRNATLCAGCCCLLLVAGAWVAWHPSWYPQWMISPNAALWELAWLPPVAALLFSISVRQAREREQAAAAAGRKDRWHRRALYLGAVSVVLLGFETFLMVGRLGWLDWTRDVLPQYRGPDGRPKALVSRDNVVLQTTGYTCGPAACATLLRLSGIAPDATEAELVPLCQTRPWLGSSLLGMAVGLKAKAAPKGWQVRMVEPGWDELARLRKPLLCEVRYAATMNHMVVLCAVDSRRGVLIADPLAGRSWWTKARFEANFAGCAVVVFRERPYEPSD